MKFNCSAVKNRYETVAIFYLFCLPLFLPATAIIEFFIFTPAIIYLFFQFIRKKNEIISTEIFFFPFFIFSYFIMLGFIYGVDGFYFNRLNAWKKVLLFSFFYGLVVTSRLRAPWILRAFFILPAIQLALAVFKHVLIAPESEWYLTSAIRSNSAQAFLFLIAIISKVALIRQGESVGRSDALLAGCYIILSLSSSSKVAVANGIAMSALFCVYCVPKFKNLTNIQIQRWLVPMGIIVATIFISLNLEVRNFSAYLLELALNDNTTLDGFGSGRFQIWSFYLNSTTEQPLIGLGLNAVNQIHTDLGGPFKTKFNDLHNQYLMIYYESGVVGLSMIFGFLFFVVYRSKDVVLFIFIVICLSNFMFNTSLTGFVEGRVIWIWLGCMVGYSALIRVSKPTAA